MIEVRKLAENNICIICQPYVLFIVSCHSM